MSFSGISKVKNSASIFVDKEKRGITDSVEYSSSHINVEYVLNLPYTNNKSSIRLRNNASINVDQTLSSPAAGYVNLGFSFLNVDSANSQSQVSNAFVGTQKSLVVDNSLTYTYTNSRAVKNNISTRLINILSTNSEHSITVNLDGESLPEVETFYQNYEVVSDIELNEDEVWS